MRLIDADVLLQHFKDMQHYEKCSCNFSDHRGEPSTNWYCVESALENASTIAAIPVEWIGKFCADDIAEDQRETIEWMIKVWKREQEAR